MWIGPPGKSSQTVHFKMTTDQQERPSIVIMDDLREIKMGALSSSKPLKNKYKSRARKKTCNRCLKILCYPVSCCINSLNKWAIAVITLLIVLAGIILCITIYTNRTVDKVSKLYDVVSTDVTTLLHQAANELSQQLRYIRDQIFSVSLFNTSENDFDSSIKPTTITTTSTTIKPVLAKPMRRQPADPRMVLYPRVFR